MDLKLDDWDKIGFVLECERLPTLMDLDLNGCGWVWMGLGLNGWDQLGLDFGICMKLNVNGFEIDWVWTWVDLKGFGWI